MGNSISLSAINNVNYRHILKKDDTNNTDSLDTPTELLSGAKELSQIAPQKFIGTTAAEADEYLRAVLGLGSSSIDNQLSKLWEHYKATKIESSGRPIADDQMTFSETISYVLPRALEMNDKETFDKVLTWALQNLVRKNIKEVFYANKSIRSWEAPYKQDHLLAWRYITLNSSINNLPNLKLDKPGIPSWDWTIPEQQQPWVDGLDAAPDADILIADTLAKADKKWGNGGTIQYKVIAQEMLPDIWNKCILNKKIGGDTVTIDFENMWTENTNAEYVRKSPENLKIAFGNKESWGGIVGIHSLGLSTLHTYDSLGITAISNAPTTIKLVFQDQAGNEFGVDLKLSETKKTYTIPIKNIVQRINYEFRGQSIKTVGKTEFKNFAIQGECNTTIDIENIQLSISAGKEGIERFFVSSNDKKSPVLNLSYVMPFALKTFVDLDQTHPWYKLAEDFYTTVTEVTAGTMQYTDAKNPSKIYSGNLIPDWNAISSEGKITDAYKTWDSFATSDVQDTNLASWDSLRAYLWIATDYQQTKSPQAKKELEKIATFFKKELQRQNWIDNAYNTDGSVVANNRRGAQSKDSPFGMAVALGVFAGLGDKENTQRILDLLQPYYHNEGYLGSNPDDYFTNNIFAFSLAMTKNMGLTIKTNLEPIKSEKLAETKIQEKTEITIPTNTTEITSTEPQPIILTTAKAEWGNGPIAKKAINTLTLSSRKPGAAEMINLGTIYTQGYTKLLIKIIEIADSKNFEWGGKAFGLSINGQTLAPKGKTISADGFINEPLNTAEILEYDISGISEAALKLKTFNSTTATYSINFYLQK